MLTRSIHAGRYAGIALLGLAAACRGPREVVRAPASEPAAAAPSTAEEVAVGQDIVICGTRVPIGAPVVLWTDPPFYDASRTEPRFATPSEKNVGKLRYQPGRVRRVPNPALAEGSKSSDAPATDVPRTVDEVLVPPDATDASALREVVDQFVLHFDVCGISRTCFRVLQDERNLSVHFLLDVDGTLYQTLDLRDTAWHATKSNPRSIGIEIAQIGAYAPREAWRLEPWYEREGDRTRLTIPARIRETGIRTPGFQGYCARPERLVGAIQGDVLHQHDFTPEQYRSLAQLAAALCREFPRIRPDAPRDEHGFVLDRALDDDAWRSFQGILGHFHVQENKVDPGPAFDWEPFLEATRARLVAPIGG